MKADDKALRLEAAGILRRARELAEPTRGSRGWAMDPATAYYHDASMNGFGDIVWSDDCGGGCAESFTTTDAERAAFGLDDDAECVVLHYSDMGGAPDMETCTLAELAAYAERMNPDEDADP
jgi:hypothetical protein